MGIGGAEAGILLIIVFVLFGPTLLAFWLGYVLGQKRKDAAPAEPPAPVESHASAEPQPSAEPTPPAPADTTVPTSAEKDSE